jgi:beta-N-acetylhexosaminidase
MTSSAQALEIVVERHLAGLSLDRKVAQLVTVPIPDAAVGLDEQRLAEWLEFARDYGVGSFVVYGGTPAAVARLTNRLQAVAELPLLFASDYEGGVGQQVDGATEFPANMAFAAAGSEELMYRAGSIAATEGRALGVHLTYCPVVDVSPDPTNPAESVRSFGAEIGLLGRLVRAHVRGLHDHGMLATAKHFPGRGDVRPMPGRPGWLLLDKPRDELERTELAAFKHAIDAGVDFVMTEHIAVPALTEGSELPASVEERLARGWLRDRLGFNGILTSDDLWYDHVVARFGAEEVAVLAFEAGHDMLLKPRDPIATIAALVGAVRSGRIPSDRIDDAVRRVLAVKVRLGLFERRLVDESLVETLVGTPDHVAVAQEVADRSLTCLRRTGPTPSLLERPDGTYDLVNVSVEKTPGDPGPLALAKELAQAFPGSRSYTLTDGTNASDRAATLEAAAGAELLLVSLFVQRDKYGEPAPLRATDMDVLEQLLMRKQGAAVVVAFGNPHLVRRLPEEGTFLVGYGERGWFGNQSTYFGSVIRAIRGELTPAGRLPVHVGPRYPIGYRAPAAEEDA